MFKATGTGMLAGAGAVAAFSFVERRGEGASA